MRFFFPLTIILAVGFLLARDPGGFVTSTFSKLTSASAASSVATSGGATHYSPTENLEAIDAGAIVSSRCDHLDVAMYSFTDWKLAEAIVTFANSGRPVHIYRDRMQYQQEYGRNSRVPAMFQGHRNIQIRVKASTVLMHVKSWSDGCIVRDGSANWSPSGEKQQDNTLTLSSDSGTVHNFETKFSTMWNRTDNTIIQ